MIEWDRFDKIDRTNLKTWELDFPRLPDYRKLLLITDNLKKGNYPSQGLIKHILDWNDDNMVWHLIEMVNRYIDGVPYETVEVSALGHLTETIIQTYRSYNKEERVKCYETYPLLRPILNVFYPEDFHGDVRRNEGQCGVRNDLLDIKNMPESDRPLLIGAMRTHVGDSVLQQLLSGDQPILIQTISSLPLVLF